MARILLKYLVTVIGLGSAGSAKAPHVVVCRIKPHCLSTNRESELLSTYGSRVLQLFYESEMLVELSSIFYLELFHFLQ